MAVSTLENKYYRIIRAERQADSSAVFRVALPSDCEVYRGHFPGRPVCPGVCQVELVRQCAARLTGCKLLIRSIALCRFLAVASPETCPEMDVTIGLQPVGEQAWQVTARLSDNRVTYMEFKGEVGV